MAASSLDGDAPGPAAAAEVAVFDFDGTLTRRDSFLPFLRFAVPLPRLLAGLAVAGPAMAGHVARVVPNWAAKEALLRAVLGGVAEAEVVIAGERFARDALPHLLRPGAAAAIAAHRTQGRRLVLVSASLECYLAPWGRQAGFDDVLATRLEAVSGRLSGRLIGRNCWGEEKVARLRGLLGDLDGWLVHAYGDSRGDRELLAIAARPHYRELGVDR